MRESESERARVPLVSPRGPDDPDPGSTRPVRYGEDEADTEEEERGGGGGGGRGSSSSKA